MAHELITPQWLIDDSVRRLRDMVGDGWKNAKTENGYQCGCPCGCSKAFAFHPKLDEIIKGWQRFGDAIICDDCAMRNEVARAVAWVGIPTWEQ